jgi:hypothetical protein
MRIYFPWAPKQGPDCLNVKCSDGRERSENFEGTDLQKAIIAYFEEPLEEELLRLRWDNEYMRKQLAERASVKVAAAAAGILR